MKNILKKYQMIDDYYKGKFNNDIKIEKKPFFNVYGWAFKRLENHYWKKAKKDFKTGKIKIIKSR